MADTVNTNVLLDGGRYYIAQFTNESDGTGESGVIKVNISDLTMSTTRGVVVPDKLAVMEIQHSVQGFNYVTVEFDADTNDEIAVLSGDGVKVFAGGINDPQSTGTTGDILFTTDGGADGSSYDITLVCKMKN